MLGAAARRLGGAGGRGDDGGVGGEDVASCRLDRLALSVIVMIIFKRIISKD